MSVARIEKYFNDQVSVLSSGKLPKINSELHGLGTWLVKHQDESVPDGAKNKILSILEKYYRCAMGHNAAIRGSVIQLFSDFLALPEGKLCGSKDKKRVLGWYNSLNADADADAAEGAPKAAAIAPVLSLWSVQGLDAASSSVTLLSEANAEFWMERVKVDDMDIFAAMRSLYEAAEAEGAGEVRVEWDETVQRIVRVLE
jgi:hypothetical protein